MENDIVVKMENISKYYGNISALNNANLYLRKGEVLGLVGDNAAGKSTITKILSGAVIPDKGKIYLNQKEKIFKNPSDAKSNKIEMVYQDLSLCDSLDVSGNLFLGREIIRNFFGFNFLNKNQMNLESQKILNELSIKVKSTKQKVEFLSGGQRQSIAIGKAISSNPEVLIMDEPTSALAIAEVESVLRLINEVKKRGVSVILITHRLQDIFKVCDRVTVMFEGKDVADKSIQELDLNKLVSLIVQEH